MSSTAVSSGSPHEADDVCPECSEAFDTDKSLMKSSDHHRLPFTCSGCFYFTLCAVCLDALDRNSFECPVCHKKEGFDRDDPVPNLRLCSVLNKQQGGAQAQKPVAEPTPLVTLVASDADSSLSEATSHGASNNEPNASSQASSAVLISSTRATRVKGKKTEKSAPARRVSGGRKYPPKRRNKRAASLGDEYKANDRVYCRWPETNGYYWGHIAEVHNKDNEPATYKIKFDDGDVRDDVQWREFVTEDEYNRYQEDEGSLQAPKRERAKRSRSSRSQVSGETPSGMLEDDRKPAAVSTSRAPLSKGIESVTAQRAAAAISPTDTVPSLPYAIEFVGIEALTINETGRDEDAGNSGAANAAFRDGNELAESSEVADAASKEAEVNGGDNQEDSVMGYVSGFLNVEDPATSTEIIRDCPLVGISDLLEDSCSLQSISGTKGFRDESSMITFTEQDELDVMGM